MPLPWTAGVIYGGVLLPTLVKRASQASAQRQVTQSQRTMKAQNAGLPLASRMQRGANKVKLHTR